MSNSHFPESSSKERKPPLLAREIAHEGNREVEKVRTSWAQGTVGKRRHRSSSTSDTLNFESEVDYKAKLPRQSHSCIVMILYSLTDNCKARHALLSHPHTLTSHMPYCAPLSYIHSRLHPLTPTLSHFRTLTPTLSHRTHPHIMHSAPSYNTPSLLHSHTLTPSPHALYSLLQHTFTSSPHTLCSLIQHELTASPHPTRTHSLTSCTVLPHPTQTHSLIYSFTSMTKVSWTP